MSLSSDLVIVRAEPEDLEELAALEAISFPPDEAASKAAFAYRLASFPDWFLTAREDGKIAGFINGILSDRELITDELYLPDGGEGSGGANLLLFGLAVHPDYRRRGIAGKLIKAILDIAEKNKIKHVALTCRDVLIPYYEKFGFENRGVSESVIGNVTWYDMVFEA